MAAQPATAEILDLFSASSLSLIGRATERLVCAQEDCWITRLLVKPHQQVSCGKVLCETHFTDQAGKRQTGSILAPDYGIVKPIKNAPLFPLLHTQKLSAIYVKRGTPLFLITREKTGQDAGTIKGLTPRPTRVMYLRRLRALLLLKQYKK